ncbi:hypothetical protein F0562_034355 [Nyssa sinensis]|uniref:Uncharacterized protein n=1 Tax=Nyssa sinensis TaxID=561372 RepID=A0A5J5AKX4_9ASTE|nr:hypothetical protein F0562_034355 [Nyssa sinensis]
MMSPAELQEQRNKGLCYNCNEKFIPRHRYNKLFFIDTCLEDGDDDTVMKKDDEVDNPAVETPRISFHAINDTSAPETMLVKGKLKHMAVTILAMVAYGERLVSPGTQ